MPMTGEQRYLHDAEFKMLVDTIHSLIDKLQYTPSEIRDAAMLAAIHYEMRQIRPLPVERFGDIPKFREFPPKS
jgi:hypothetical protein